LRSEALESMGMKGYTMNSFLKGMLRVVPAALLAVLLCACGSEPSDKSNTAPVADSGPDIVMGKGMMVTLDGSGSSDPGGKIVKYRWSSSSSAVTLTRDDIASPVLWVPPGCSVASVEFTLTVTDDGGLTASDSCTVTIEDFSTLNEQGYESALYAAYAGIGYGIADETDDDAFHYNAMVDDPNMLLGNILSTTLTEELFTNYNLDNPILDLVRYRDILGYWHEPKDEVVVSYDSPGDEYHAELTIRPVHEKGTSNYTYTADMTVDIATYAYGDCTYTGSGTTDMSAQMEGSYVCDDIRASELADPDVLASKLKKFICSRLELSLAGSLSGVYTGGNTVAYSGWSISYDVDDTTNRVLMPLYLEFDVNGNAIPYDGPDIRDYSVSGAFSINGDDYYYCEGFRYRKGAEDTYTVIDDTYTDASVVSVNGALMMPGVPGIIVIRSGYNTADPAADGSIIRDAAGRWISGDMLFNESAANNSSAEVSFSLDGGANASFVWGSTLWEVVDWQAALDSYD
jgi:hypothetical protein